MGLKYYRGQSCSEGARPEGRQLKQASSSGTSRRTVVGVTGLPGSGKTSAAEVARKLGYTVIVMGDFVRAEAQSRGLEPSAENLGRLMLEMRKERGEAILAELTVEAVEKAGSPFVFVDGVRSPAEVEEFRRRYPGFKLIATVAPSQARFQRLSQRLRSDNALSWETLRKRDERELQVGVEAAVNLSDITIENKGSLEAFEAEVRKVLERMKTGNSP